MSEPVVIRRLTTDDAMQYRTLRLHGLSHEPTAFGDDYDEAIKRPDDFWIRALDKHGIHFGAFAGAELIAKANYSALPGRKLRHRAFVYGVYVHPDFVSRGIGALVLTALAEHARGEGVTQLHLGVAADNEPAKALYTKLGYKPYGHEPSAIRLPDRDIDEILMIKMLG
ncbi:MAG: GNAT family N-acetyltransferase [Pseudomonadota bacterium]